MPTTSNFGWTTPADTDLVKDGALAIRTLGNGIDTSMAQLKGGTAGQVLSKTNGTDMAFTWVTQDDANAIQNAIVDAKGDLIAATANDTPARLAVGSNNFFLRANSSASTGLEWAGSWTSYTPVISQNGNLTSTINYAKYLQIGNMVVVQVQMTATQAGTANNRIGVTLPLTAASATSDRAYGTFCYADSGTAYYVGSVGLQTTTLAYFIVHNAQDFVGVSPNFAVANTDKMTFTMIYEVA